MPFWRKETPREAQEREAQQRAIQALEAGDIPPVARQRLERERKHGSDFFTSDLSCREYLFVKEAGFQTLGQVTGTSFFRVKWSAAMAWKFTRATKELTDLTASRTKSMQAAIGRMRKEAELSGASGVIGVRIIQRGCSWAAGVTEFTAIGTAIRVPGWPVEELPFTSTLNGQDFWQLFQTGFEPRSIVFGVCAYYVFTDPETRKNLYTWLGTNNRNNMEVAIYTEGYYRARERANNRMLQAMKLAAADGVVDVSFEPDIEVITYDSGIDQYDLLFNFSIMGTAVRKSARPPIAASKPLLCLNLSTQSFENLGSTGERDPDSLVAPDMRVGVEQDVGE